MWGVAIYAFRRGGWAEKLAASGIVITTYLSVLLVSSPETHFHQLERSVAFVDLGLLLFLMLISMQSRKFWPLWLTAFQGITLLGHFAPYLQISAWIYQRATASWSWPMLIVLALGVAGQRKTPKAAKSGTEPISAHNRTNA